MATYYDGCDDRFGFDGDGYPPPPVHPGRCGYYEDYAYYGHRLPAATQTPPTAAIHLRPRPSSKIDIVNPATKEAVVIPTRSPRLGVRAGWGQRLDHDVPDEHGTALSATAEPYEPPSASSAPTSKPITVTRPPVPAAALPQLGPAVACLAAAAAAAKLAGSADGSPSESPARSGSGEERESEGGSRQSDEKTDTSPTKSAALQTPVQKVIVTFPSPPCKPLGSATSESGASTRPGSALPLASGLDAIARKVNGILNRMTPEKFSRLLQDLLRLLTKEVLFSGENMRVLLGRISQMIFEKAIAEPNFADMYAELCAELHKQVDALGVENGESGEGIIKTSRQRLQALLLNLCQKEFEASLTVQRDTLLGRGCCDEEAKLRAKQRKVGNITFIAALFKRQLMPEQIVHLVVQRLLNMSSQTGDPPSESDVEILCKLLEVAGERMDRPAAQEYMGRYFTRMRKLSTSHPCSRARYLILGVVEKRDQCWRRQQRLPLPPPDAGPALTSPVLCRSESKNSACSSDSPPARALYRRGSMASLGSPPSRPVSGGASSDPVERTVYVTGLDTALHPGELDAFLGLHGKVVKRRLCGDSSHATRFGFFEFDTQEAAHSLLRKEGLTLGRHPIHCSMARAAIHDRSREDEREAAAARAAEAVRGELRRASSAQTLSSRRPRLPSVVGSEAKGGKGPGGGSTPPSKPLSDSFADRFGAALSGPRSFGSSSKATSPSSLTECPTTSSLHTAHAHDDDDDDAHTARQSRATPEITEDGVSDIRMELKAQNLVTEMGANDSVDEYLAGVGEVPAAQRGLCVALQLAFAASQSRFGTERKRFGAALSALSRVERHAVSSGFSLGMEHFSETELWIDVPMLWRNLAEIVRAAAETGDFDEGMLRGGFMVLAQHTEWDSLHEAFTKAFDGSDAAVDLDRLVARLREGRGGSEERKTAAHDTKAAVECISDADCDTA
eukprot:TRINITY_DN9462_c0_g1_i1.p1 TRINITY_DN9462_c0_g1~~TRINITY_DN9462_c0_g1_i1.p1  ORF type:complete len:960 (+),score=344.64 TRINITY_DN9462_c0_g1_i1:256-3135(+)